MSKGMPTGLELAEDLKSFAFRFNQKSAVDRLYVSGALNQIEKELKAFEIIKKKRVDVHKFIACSVEGGSRRYNAYMAMLYFPGCSLAKKEFDLLEEVLWQGD